MTDYQHPHHQDHQQQQQLEQKKIKNMALASYSLGGAALIGFGITGFSIFKMMQSQHRGDSVKCLHWQRVRVVATSLSISLLSLPLLLPQLSNTFILFRTS